MQLLRDDAFPHEKREAQTHGRSPGNGTTAMPLSREPLATEGEATPGPDDYNPYEDDADPRGRVPNARLREDPTRGEDPYVFDDVDDAVGEVSLPGVDGEREVMPLW